MALNSHRYPVTLFFSVYQKTAVNMNDFLQRKASVMRLQCSLDHERVQMLNLCV